MDYLHDFYADTAMFGGGVHVVRCGYEFGADHVVFATARATWPDRADHRNNQKT